MELLRDLKENMHEDVPVALQSRGKFYGME
jgi:hypothetical protein